MEKQIWEALRKVKDLELGINVVDLGLIYEVKEAEGKIAIAMSPTTPFCPYLPQMIKQIKKAVRDVSGGKKVEVAVVWVPPWTSQRMSTAARAELGMI